MSTVARKRSASLMSSHGESTERAGQISLAKAAKMAKAYAKQEVSNVLARIRSVTDASEAHLRYEVHARALVFLDFVRRRLLHPMSHVVSLAGCAVDCALTARNTGRIYTLRVFFLRRRASEPTEACAHCSSEETLDRILTLSVSLPLSFRYSRVFRDQC